MGALHQADHAVHGDGAGFGLLDRAELGGGDGDDAGHYSAASLRAGGNGAGLRR